MILKGGRVLIDGKLETRDVLIVKNEINRVSKSISGANEIDVSDMLLIPGAIDPHVHLREPGFEYKETIETGSMAALSRWLHINLCNAKFKPSSIKF